MNKIIVICLILSLSTINATNPNITLITKVKDFAMGLSIGMGALAQMPDAVGCVMGSEQLITDVQSVIKSIESGSFDINTAIQAIEKISSEFSSVLGKCQNLSVEGKTFFYNIFQHFAQIQLIIQGIQNIAKNFTKVSDDVNQGIAFIKKGDQETDFLVAGSKFGDIIKIYVNGVSTIKLSQFIEIAAANSTLFTKIEHLLLGFVFGSRALAQLPDALGCITNMLNLKSEITQLIDDLKNKSFDDAIKVITELAQQIPDDQIKCNALKNELIVYGQDVEQCFTNSTRIQEGASNLIQNVDAIISSFQSIISSFESGQDQDFQNIGFQLGNIFSIYGYGTQSSLQLIEKQLIGGESHDRNSVVIVKKFLN